MDHTDIDQVRSFNRLYTSRLGFLKSRLDGSPFTLTQGRILYEIASRECVTASEIANDLKIDKGQLSRTIAKFARSGFVKMQADPVDLKRQILSLTEKGRQAFGDLEASTRVSVGEILNGITPFRRHVLVSALSEATNLLSRSENEEVKLTGLRPGDLGAVISRQAMIYAEEYQWDRSFEALIARILADFSANFDPAKDEAWIARVDDLMAGSIFLTHSGEEDVAKLRLLYVEPSARGLGIGTQLVKACIQRARELGYERLELWTNSILHAARKIYEREGFRLVAENNHCSFGHNLTGQTWSLPLDRS